MAARLTSPPTLSIAVYFVLLPDSLILDWAGPAEALRTANEVLRSRGQPAVFTLHFVSPEPTAGTSVGVQVTGLTPLPELGTLSSATTNWVVLVGQPGQKISLDTPQARDVLHWLRGLRLGTSRLELLCVCAGAILAARAGLLAGHRVTTHHLHLEELRDAEPACDVVTNRVFVLDAPVATSAGVTTGIDLMLHRIGETCGQALAAQVAQRLVVAMRRGPHDPELSPFLCYRDHLHPALHRVQDAVSQEPQKKWTIPAMAAVAHTSARHLARLFSEHAGISPLDYLRSIRLAAASTALHSGFSVSRAAAIAGFSSDAQLRRTWHDLGMPGRPSDGLP